MTAPAVLWVPPRVGSYGDEACDLMELVGRPLDESQRIAVDAMLSYGPGGRWVALEQVIVQPRQNGKSAAVITAVVLFDLFCLPPDDIAWSAHLFKTARKSFFDIKGLIEGTPELSRRVKKCREANGEEGFELYSGAQLNFLARSKGGGRGLGGKRVVMDEALILAPEAMESLMPTLAARPDPQLTYGSSAGLETSAHLHSLMRRGRRGNDPSLIWVEWKAQGGWDAPPCQLGDRCPHALGTDGCYLDDEDAWAAANPSLDKRITRSYVRGERRSLTPSGFGRERLGWFEELAVEEQWRTVSAADWARCEDARSEIPEDAPVTLALEVAYGGLSASVGVAGQRADGLIHVELAVTGPGTEWCVSAVAKMAAEIEALSGEAPDIVVDPRGPAGPLIPDLEAAGLTVVQPDTAGVVAAYTRFVEACSAEHDRVRHIGQAPLSTAAQFVGNRTVGDRLLWERKCSGTDVAPIVVVSLAFWGHVLRVEDEQPFFMAWR